MKRLALLFLAMVTAFSAQAGPLTRWTLQREGQKTVYQVDVPCTVAGALNEAGYFGPDVLEEDRYKAIDKTIFDVMNKEQIDLLDTRFKEVFHVSITDSLMKSVWKYQPLVLTTSFNLLLTVQEMQKHPEISMSNTPIDLVCINRAKERGMAFGQLDEIQPEDSLKKMRDTMNEKIDDQIDSLMNYLQDFEHRKQMVANEIEVMAMSEKCWKEADYDNYASLPKMVTEVNKQPAVFKQRNEKWLPKLQAAMSEAPTMFVFGAGHLIGEYGVLQLLRQVGYDVEQIKRIRGTGNLIH